MLNTLLLHQMLFNTDLHVLQFGLTITFSLLNAYILFEALYMTRSPRWLYALVVTSQAYNLSRLFHHGSQMDYATE